MSLAQNPPFVRDYQVSRPSVYVWVKKARLTTVFVDFVERAAPSTTAKPILR